MSASLTSAIALYMQYLRATGHPATTVTSVASCLRIFARYVGPVTVAVAAQQIIPFLAERSVHLRHNSQSTYFSFMHGFFAFCVRQGYLAADPLAGLRAPKPERVVTQPLTDREIMALYEVGDRWTRPMLVLLLGSGMRIGELSGLRWADVRDGQVLVRGKGSKERTLAPGRRAMAMLYALPRDGEWVFPFTCTSAKDRMRRLSRVAHVPMHPHQFRHTFAHKFLRASGGDIVTLSALMGHESLSTTMIYLRSASREEMLAKQREYNPADALFKLENNRGKLDNRTAIA